MRNIYKFSSVTFKPNRILKGCTNIEHKKALCLDKSAVRN